MNENRILIIHPDSSARTLLASMLQTLAVQLEEAPNDPAAVRRLERGGVDLIVAGVEPEDPDCLELLHYMKRKFPALPVILLFSVGDAERTREARQRGADAVLRFPLPATQLRAAVSQALGQAEPSARTAVGAMSSSTDGRPSNSAPKGSGTRESAHGWTFLNGSAGTTPSSIEPGHCRDSLVLIGEDESLRQTLELAETIASTRATVLIQGEPGTGKSLMARIIHQRSPRAGEPFVEVRCSEESSGEIDRFLFGEQPMLRPATSGQIERAQGGTLYLDDVASLGPELQAKLLRLLRDGVYEPIGASRPERADVRLIFGTKENLEDRVAKGGFRQDLWYRMSVATLKLSPLRHRGTDLDRLAEHFRFRAAQRNDRTVSGFSSEAMAMMRRYHWPLNIQELEAVVERAVLICRGRLIEPNDLVFSSAPITSRGSGDYRGDLSQIRPLKEALEEPEKQIILEALKALGWNRQETARVLDINRTTLYKKMKKYGLLVDELAWAN
ncbi:sigma-54-dependent transcriptional regulator [Tautonia rosea]|uniref:sigma-54-dependent transcriptional regulator n=1 Tax=Tautonia rosea TaxID=2728037 RepID=UPI001473E716|nr:sigma-54 dependent transcriptional regulator [Tautonia rosea]